MRKITWLIVLFIVITWLSISTYWTGNENTKKPTQESIFTVTPTLELDYSPPSTESSMLETSTESSVVVEGLEASDVTSSAETVEESRLKY